MTNKCWGYTSVAKMGLFTNSITTSEHFISSESRQGLGKISLIQFHLILKILKIFRCFFGFPKITYLKDLFFEQIHFLKMG